MPLDPGLRQALYPLITLYVLVTGACIGSFLNVVIWRLPRGESLSRPPSHCPRCGHRIRPWENIPLLSWACLRGRCSSCRQPISVRYPLIEGAVAVLFYLLWVRVNRLGLPWVVTLPYVALASALFAAACIDVEHLLIPDRITKPGVVAGVVFAVLLPVSHPVAMALPAGPPGPGLWGDWLVRLVGPPPHAAGVLRGVAGADALAGAALGFALLWAAAEIGKRLWGERRLFLAEPVELHADAAGVRLGAEFAGEWEDVLVRDSDRLRVDVAEATVAWTADGGQPSTIQLQNTHLEIGRSGLRAGEQTVPLAALTEVRGRARAAHVPREVLGRGDAKLLAMVGAFVGLEAVAFVLMLGAVAGAVVGTLALVTRCRAAHQPLPFGPFLAAGALAWLLAGPEFSDWYGRLLWRLLG